MAATGIPGFKASAGTKLKYGNYSASPTYANSFSIRKFGGLPATKVDSWETTQVDAVNTDGTPDLNKYFAFGKTDPGEMMFTIAAIDAQVTALYALQGVISSFQITFGLSASQTTAATMTWAGAVTAIKPTVGEKDEVLFEITVKISGPLTFTAGT